MEKKVFEEPVVTKVEIDFSDRVIAAGCALITGITCDDMDFPNTNS